MTFECVRCTRKTDNKPVKLFGGEYCAACAQFLSEENDFKVLLERFDQIEEE